MFPNKNWSLGGLKALIKNDNAVLCMRGRSLPNMSNNRIYLCCQL